MRKLLWLAILALVAGPVAPAPAVDPTVTVRVRSLDDLIDKFEYLGGIVGQGEAAKQAGVFARGLADPKTGIEGIDPTRPIGLYGVLTDDVFDSYAVLVAPIADEKLFLDLLTGKLSIDPKKGEDGVYEVDVPNVPQPVFFRFANKSVYITFRSAKPLDAKTLVAPADLFIGKEDAIAAARVYLDRIPKGVRGTVIGQFELQIAQQKEKKDPGATPAQQKLKGWALDSVTDALASVLSDGKELAVRLLVEPTTDDLTTELTLSGKTGTPLTTSFRAASSEEGRAASIGAKSSLFSGGVKLTVPERLRQPLNGIIDELLEEAVSKANESEQPLLKTLVAAVSPTLKSGVVELGLGIAGPNKGRSASVVSAVRLSEGLKIEQFLKTIGAILPADKGKLTFDIEKTNGLTLHKFTGTDEKFEKQFGTDTVWLAINDSLLLVSVESSGDIIRAAAKQKATVVPVFTANLSLARMFRVTEEGLTPEAIAGLIDDVFKGASDDKDTLRVTISGGEKLTVRMTLKGKALQLSIAVDQAKKAK